MSHSIAVIPGDGIGPEIVHQAVKTLKAVAEKKGHDFKLINGHIGAAAFEELGQALPDETLKLCKIVDAVLFGAVGEPKWEVPGLKNRPEPGYGLIRLRGELGLFANLRPLKMYPALVECTSLKPEVVNGLDLVLVRELTGGIYFSRPKEVRRGGSGREAVDTMFYTEDEIRRILKVGFELAAQRTGKLTSVDKFQILKVSELWREVAREVAAEYPQVELEHVLVDNCAMRLIKRPTDFDVIVTSNLFGDVLSDEAAMLVGSVGMSPSASLAGIPTTGSKLFGLYEPIHGSSPNRANQDMANPVGTILSAAMLLRYSLGLSQEADMVDHAVAAVLEQGYRTYDIMAPGMQMVGTQKMGDLVAEQILNQPSPA